MSNARRQSEPDTTYGKVESSHKRGGLFFSVVMQRRCGCGANVVAVEKYNFYERHQT